MEIYLISFILSCTLLWISNKIRNNRELKFLINGIAILIPCVIAGLRNTVIGTDVEVYVKQLFDSAKISSNYSEYLNCSWWWIYRVKYVSDFEGGFTFLVYLIVKLTNNIQWVLFFIQLLIMIPIYFGLKKIDGIGNKIYLAILIFYFSFYNIGLNTMRQYIAIAFIFYGTCCLMYDHRGAIKFFCSLILAFLFHNSSIFCVLIFLIYKLLNRKYKKDIVIKINSNTKIKLKSIIVISSVFLSIFLVLNANFFIKIFAILGIKDYSGWAEGEVTLMWSKIMRIIPILIIFLGTGKYYIKNDSNSYMYIILFVMSVAFSQFASVTQYGERMSYMFQIFNIVSIPSLCYSHPNKTIRKGMIIFIVCYYIIYWYYYFVFGNSGETVPYKFYWQ